jgi:hypothetical protein
VRAAAGQGAPKGQGVAAGEMPAPRRLLGCKESDIGQQLAALCRASLQPMLTSSRRSYGLAWSPLKQGHILAASEDQTVCEWDVNQYKKSDNVLEPLKTYRGHTAVVEVRFREQRQAKARKRAQADVPPPPPARRMLHGMRATRVCLRAWATTSCCFCERRRRGRGILAGGEACAGG